ncbi:hypothetical protein ACJZ2D_007398 [Fusarium nematophilum]
MSLPGLHTLHKKPYPAISLDHCSVGPKEAKEKGLPAVSEGRICDVTDLDATASLWSNLKSDGIYVDTLVLNAASLGNP